MLFTATRLRNHAVDTLVLTQPAGVFIACTTHGNSAPFSPVVASR